jgi:molybdenum cofactor cytidylyltransferase
MSVAAVVPAAGKGERFGGAKLLADVGGEALVNRTVRSLLDGGVDRVVVVAASGGVVMTAGVERVPLFGDPRVRLVVNPDPERGMFSSIQEGLKAVTAGIVLVLPADMPFVDSRTIAAVVRTAAAGTEVVSPRHAGRRGHPVALPGSVCEAVLTADVGSNLKQVLADLDPPRTAMDVVDPGILRDVDVAGDLA